MKKLLACLMALTLLWLPLYAVAENAVCTRITMDADADQLAPLLEHLTGSKNAMLSKGVAALLKSFRMDMVHQDNGIQWTMHLQDEEIFSMTLLVDDEQGKLLFNFLPDYVLTGSAHQVEEAALQDALNQINWASWLQQVQACWQEIASEDNVTQNAGSFSGDTYNGGTRKWTLLLEDTQLAQMLNVLADAMQQDEGLAELEMLGIRVADLMDAFREKNRQVASENRYHYEISAVYDDADELLALHATAMEGTKQLSTLEIKPGDQAISMVWGYGMGSMNCFITGGVQWAADDAGLAISGMFDVMSGKNQSMQLAEYLLEEDLFGLTISPDGSYQGGVQLIQFQSETPTSIALMFSGQAQDVTTALYWGESETPAVLLNAEAAPCDPVQVNDEERITLNMENMTEAESELLAEAMEEEINAWAVEVFKLLPAELILMLIQ